jgi:menaquinone-dependent protoporphyrinogen oxidase
MSNRVLVTYASRAGSTKGVAEAIGQVLATSGMQIDVLPMTAVTDLTQYSAVVAGSAIRDRKWLPEATRFVQTNQMILAQKPFAAFLVCITLAMRHAADYRQGVTEWMQPVRVLVKPISEGYFAGSLDFSMLPLFPDGLRMRIPVVLGLFPQGDHRDWEVIRTWAGELAALLQPHVVK